MTPLSQSHQATKQRTYAKNTLQLSMLLLSSTLFALPALAWANSPSTSSVSSTATTAITTAKQTAEQGDTPLHQAIRAGDLAKINSLLAAGADVTAKNAKGETPLHLLAFFEYDTKKYTPEQLLSIVSDFKQAGADLEALDNEGWTPLLRAAQQDNTVTMRMLLEQGANPNAKTPKLGNTPLHLVSTRLSANILTIDKNRAKVNLEATNNQGETPLMTAVQRGDNIVIWVLLEAGANVNALNPDTSNSRLACRSKAGQGKTALAYAVANHDVYTMKQLLDAGADVNIKINDCDASSIIHARSIVENSAKLGQAIEDNDMATVKELINAGALVNSNHYSLFAQVEKGNTEIAVALLNQDINQLAEPLDFLAAQGRIIDTRGRIIDTQGRIIDTQGRIIDTRGRIIDTRGRIIDTTSSTLQLEKDIIALKEFNATLAKLKTPNTVDETSAISNTENRNSTSTESDTPDIEQTQARMEQTKADMEQTKADMEQSKADMEQSKADMEQSKADMEQSKAELKQKIAEYIIDYEKINTVIKRYTAQSPQHAQKFEQFLNCAIRNTEDITSDIWHSSRIDCTIPNTEGKKETTYRQRWQRLSDDYQKYSTETP
ncbi:ankyrin repeat domain-containing protein [Psychrobacter sp. I-STPA10]|uniref:ankyrin repeat domain-containing protein n=1 Tax=Psychrobacter sp. I-STPA10 TaxID=2585769 RepID=UPI001E4F48E2|nr:ankyrin repeat domain-containing protein [Psychrobacter sp. I-STPA10]